MEEKNYYQLLNVDKNATLAEIKSAYLREARLYHPDHHTGKEDEFVKKFQDIMEAYKILSDPKTRATYDRNLELKNHMVVVNPSILDSRFASILEKNFSGDFSSLKKEFSFETQNSKSAQYFNSNGGNNGNIPTLSSNNSFSYSNSDDSKRVKLEHVFQFERQGDSFKFHKQPISESQSSCDYSKTPLNSSTSSDYSRIPYAAKHLAPQLNNNYPTNGGVTECPFKHDITMFKSGEYKNSPSSSTPLPTTSLPNLLHSSSTYHQSGDYSNITLPPFKGSSSMQSSFEFKGVNNSHSNIPKVYSAQTLPPASNLLNPLAPLSSSSTCNLLSSIPDASNSQSMYDTSVTLQTSLSISFQESVFGCVKNILIKRQSICTQCINPFNPSLSNGSHNNNSSSSFVNSTGNVSVSNSQNSPQKHNSSTSHLANLDSNQSFTFSANNSHSSSHNSQKEYIILPSLPALANKLDEPTNLCKNCSGKGLYIADARVSVKVPAGVLNGSRQLLKGEGEVSNTGRKGDLIVIFNAESHPFLRRVGTRDVTCDLPLSITQATLGSTLQIPSIYGTVQVEIPSGTQHGEIIKLVDKGFTDPTDPALKGNMCIRVLIQIPTKLTPRQRELLEEFDRISQESNR